VSGSTFPTGTGYKKAFLTQRRDRVVVSFTHGHQFPWQEVPAYTSLHCKVRTPFLPSWSRAVGLAKCHIGLLLKNKNADHTTGKIFPSTDRPSTGPYPYMKKHSG
jgi:hypothetical protein